ncbi:CoA-binding protein [Clostridium sp. WILCCON 0269]|uniref:CoA-binding protein n=1 Tax=Candidatus Clostridium eludens TaxID=3381663 RepID=A0ABW8SGY4_9CLOT
MKSPEFLNYKNWVVAGSVSDDKKYAYRILNSLKHKGFNAVGMNPKSLDGGVYKSLGEVPFNVDVLDLCINPRVGIDVVKEASNLGVDKILIQPGAESDEILSFCNDNGINFVEGCALIELSKL